VIKVSPLSPQKQGHRGGFTRGKHAAWPTSTTPIARGDGCNGDTSLSLVAVSRPTIGTRPWDTLGSVYEGILTVPGRLAFAFAA
jgi:hypothetical protein